MGLDILIKRMVKVDTTRSWTDDDLATKYPKCEPLMIRMTEEVPDLVIEGSDGYLFKCVFHVYDVTKMMSALGITQDDGWCEYGSSTVSQRTPKSKRPPEDKVDCWFSFVNRHGSNDYDKWEFVEIPVLSGDDSLLSEKEFWCILVEESDLADMRKGANKKFYDDGLWDTSWMPVCSKRVLKEHMEKYFDEAPGYVYENCREAFKTIIYDKFEDGKGMCVDYA